jgi:hypothetical protein
MAEMQVYKALKDWKIKKDFSIKKGKKYIGHKNDDETLTICTHYWFAATKEQARYYFRFVKNGVDKR